ncbi:MAG: T9SS type A sorting domain-containing protein [Bacteroidetes bacterium]|jgi:hypothetical protein|nr:T9SS type A sorting domain-containing protein [Bacteroidota bacterium]
MQKITLLLGLLVTSLVSSQTVIYQESFETDANGTNYNTSIPEFSDDGNDYFTRTDGSNIATNVNISNIDGSFFFGAQDIDGEGATLPVSLTTVSVDVSSLNSVDFVVALAEDADGSNFDWDDDDYVHIFYSLDGGAEQNLLWIESTESNGSFNSEAAEDTNFDGLGDGTILTDALTDFNKSIDVSAASTIDLRIEFNLGSGDEDIALDNIRLVDGFVATPTVTITSPNDGDSFAPGTTNVDVEFTTNNLGTNDQVDITVNGATTTDVTSPFSVSTTDGNTYNVQVDVISGGSSVDNDAVSFDVGQLIQVADITALRADVNANGLGRFYEITGPSTFTHGDDFQNRKWFQDATPSGIYVEDQNGVIPNGVYAEGDQVSGLKGFTRDDNGVLTFEPTEDAGVVAGSSTVSPLVLTIADFNSNFETYESLLVGFADVTFTDGDGAATFNTGSNYEFVNGPDASDVRTTFFGADYIGIIIPDTQIVGLVGLAAEFNGATQVYPRSLADIDVTLGLNDFTTNNFSLYPNPVNNGSFNIKSQNTEAFNLEVYNVLGKRVLEFNQIQDEVINVSQLKSGVYLVKITQNESSTTKKLIIQ